MLEPAESEKHSGHSSPMPLPVACALLTSPVRAISLDSALCPTGEPQFQSKLGNPTQSHLLLTYAAFLNSGS